MSKYYNPNKTRGIYNPKSKEPFKLSRSKIELFTDCPRCFYLDRRLGVGRPPGFPFALNSAVDALLKKEFDLHRVKGTAHPLMKKYGIKAIPFLHDNMDDWRHNFTGVQALHKPTNFLVFGAVDDIWINKKNELMVVDYKSTAKAEEITKLDKDWHEGYKRQMEVYQWLLRKNGYPVSDTGYFVYCNGKTDRKAFDGKLEFDITLIPYKGTDSWINGILLKIKKTLNSKSIPASDKDCDYCAYREAMRKFE